MKLAQKQTMFIFGENSFDYLRYFSNFLCVTNHNIKYMVVYTSYSTGQAGLRPPLKRHRLYLQSLYLYLIHIVVGVCVECKINKKHSNGLILLTDFLS